MALKTLKPTHEKYLEHMEWYLEKRIWDNYTLRDKATDTIIKRKIDDEIVELKEKYFKLFGREAFPF